MLRRILRDGGYGRRSASDRGSGDAVGPQAAADCRSEQRIGHVFFSCHVAKKPDARLRPVLQENLKTREGRTLPWTGMQRCRNCAIEVLRQHSDYFARLAWRPRQTRRRRNVITDSRPAAHRLRNRRGAPRRRSRQIARGTIAKTRSDSRIRWPMRSRRSRADSYTANGARARAACAQETHAAFLRTRPETRG